MNDYIKRSELLERFFFEKGDAIPEILENGLPNMIWVRDIKYILKNITAADVAPIVHGRWLHIYENGEPAIEQHQVGVCCSECMKMPKDKFTESDYCPSCGAKMDLED